MTTDTTDITIERLRTTIELLHKEYGATIASLRAEVARLTTELRDEKQTAYASMNAIQAIEIAELKERLRWRDIRNAEYPPKSVQSLLPWATAVVHDDDFHWLPLPPLPEPQP